MLTSGPIVDINKINTFKFVKASKSSSNGACVEVAKVSHQIIVRDSKTPDSALLVFTEAEWDAFLDGVARGEFSFESLEKAQQTTSV